MDLFAFTTDKNMTPVPQGNSNDQKRSRLCFHAMYNYEMLSAVTGKDVLGADRKGRILCLGGLERAFLEKGEKTSKQTKQCSQE